MAWLTLVEDTPKANASYGTTLQISTSTATQVGDTLLLSLVSYAGLTTGVTDDAGNTYTRVASTSSSYGKYEELWQASVTKASASAVVTATASANEFYSGAVYQVRGSPIQVVSGGVLTASRGQTTPGTTPLAFPALTTSAPTFALLIGGSYYAGSAPYTLAISTPTSWTQDAALNSGSTTLSSIFGHILTTAALSGDVESIYMPGHSGNVGMGGMIVPFVAAPISAVITTTLTLACIGTGVATNAAAVRSLTSPASSAGASTSGTASVSSAARPQSRLTASASTTAAVASSLIARSAATVAATVTATAAGAVSLASRATATITDSAAATWALSLRWIGTAIKVASNLPADAWYYLKMPFRAYYAQQQTRYYYASSTPTMTAPTLSEKDPRDTVVITLDATQRLPSGATLTGILSSAVTMEYGVDPNASAVIASPQINPSPLTVPTATGTATIAANMGVQVEATAGLTGCGYLIAIQCSVSAAPWITTLKAVLPVTAQ